MSNLYALYDFKAETYLPIIEAANDAHAIRIIADAISNGLPVAQHPDDYVLHKICAYDNQSGYVTQDNRPSLVASVTTIIGEYFPARQDQADGQPMSNGTMPVEGLGVPATPTPPSSSEPSGNERDPDADGA